MVNAASAGHYGKQLPGFPTATPLHYTPPTSSPTRRCHYVRGFPFSLFSFFFLFRSASVVEKPFYGKLCCILSGNDAHPAASHPGQKMATPLCFSFTEKYLHIHLKNKTPTSSREKTNGKWHKKIK